MNSFELDQYCRDNLRSHGAPLADYAEPSPLEALSRLKEAHAAQLTAQKRTTTAWINFAIWLGFLLGIAVSAMVARIAGVL